MFHFGSVIRKLRIEKGLTQSELADRVGCTALHITKIESGHRTVSAKLFEEIFNALMLDISLESEIKAYTAFVNRHPVRVIVEELRQMPESELQYILDLIKLNKKKNTPIRSKHPK